MSSGMVPLSVSKLAVSLAPAVLSAASRARAAGEMLTASAELAGTAIASCRLVPAGAEVGAKSRAETAGMGMRRLHGVGVPGLRNEHACELRAAGSGGCQGARCTALL